MTEQDKPGEANEVPNTDPDAPAPAPDQAPPPSQPAETSDGEPVHIEKGGDE